MTQTYYYSINMNKCGCGRGLQPPAGGAEERVHESSCGCFLSVITCSQDRSGDCSLVTLTEGCASGETWGERGGRGVGRIN